MAEKPSLIWRMIYRALEVPVLFRMQQHICNDYSAVQTVFGDTLRQPGLRMLDIGCSTGASVSKIFDLERQDYTGVELVPEYAAIAQRWNPKGRFLAMDARKLDLPDASFDRAFFLGVWHHMDDDTIRRSLSEVARVLAPGGRLLVAEPMFTANRPFSTFMLNHDRGKFIRDEAGYKGLLQGWRIVKESQFDFSLHRMIALELEPEGRA